MGIYFHIPYCRQACFYCDFHFSTDKSTRQEMIKCLITEIQLRKSFDTGLVETIYFGGGTPSLLTSSEIEILLNAVFTNFDVSPYPEVTFECNPDDLDYNYLKNLKRLGINRLSIGVQSFNDDELRIMNRAHNSSQALVAFQAARDTGFENINLDLIFAIPGGSLESLQENLGKIIQLEPEHLSAYAMTIESKTVFGNWVRKGKLKEVREEENASQYEAVMHTLIEHGYSHYEISNFALPGLESRHNGNYWKGVNYLGIGPGAHSYNGEQRQFNVGNNRRYIAELEKRILPMTTEILTREQKINENIMTSIRTRWGCNFGLLKEKYGFDLYLANNIYIDQLIKNNFAHIIDESLVLTNKGKLIADSIAEKLFLP